MQSIILHLDMNSYFASVEQQDNPSWRGKVLGVCEHLGGIIIAASVEAKRWGIKTGTPVWEAKKLYPGIVLTHTRAEAYRHYHRAFLKVLCDYSNQVEPASIDEAYADVTRVCNIRVESSKFKVQSEGLSFKNTLSLNPSQNPHPSRLSRDTFPQRGKVSLNNAFGGGVGVDPFEEAVRVAEEIKQRMKKEVGDYLTCSIGIAENKLLAKIASDLRKPDAIVVIRPDGCLSFDLSLTLPSLHLRQGFGGQAGEGKNEKKSDGITIIQNSNIKNQNDNPKVKNFLNLTKQELYEKLKLTDIPGIAKRQEKRLNALGIKTLKDLRDFPLYGLVHAFGRVMGYHMHHMGKLQSSFKPAVFLDREIKSIGHMYTLPKEFRKKEFFEAVLYKLCEMVGERLRKKKLMGFGISVFAGDKEYNNYGNSHKVEDALFDSRDIFLWARKIIYSHPYIENVLKECKIIGVTVFNLKKFYKQQSLFKKPGQKSELAWAVDKLNIKYGKFTVTYVPVLKAGKVFRDSVGFGRVKEN